jgi:hypothetical protein
LRDVWEPVGPLPASVYWRRRWVAVASVLTVLVLTSWGVVTLLAPTQADEPRADPTARAASRAAAVAPIVGSAPAKTIAEASAAPGTTEVTSEQLRPDDTPRAPVPVPSSVPVPAGGPVSCTNEMLSVGAEIDSPEHRVGERPVLRLVVVNVADQPCVRDLDSQRQEIVVWSADLTQRLWSSNDCVNAPSVDLRTLVPGQPVVFSLRWAGRTTERGCPEERSVVPAGSYQVMTRIDDIISPPTPFTRLPSP